MSGIGKSTTGYKKREYAESRSIARTQKTLRFAHEATLGDTTIDLSALITPTAMSSNGFTNPNYADIAAAELLTHRNNLILKSSVNGVLEEHLDYLVTGNSKITLIPPYTAAAGEIFIGVLEGIFKTGTLVTDAKEFAATGTLSVGWTDFATGFPIPTGALSGSQQPRFAVFRNGRLQIQNEGNSSSGTGNYWLVPDGGGTSSLVRFNDPGILLPDGTLESVVVFPVGLLPFVATDGMTAALDTLSAQVDRVIEDLALVTGNPESSYFVSPSTYDLRQFGSAFTQAQADIITLGSNIAAVDSDVTALESLQWNQAGFFQEFDQTIASPTIALGVEVTAVASMRISGCRVGKTYYVGISFSHTQAVGNYFDSFTFDIGQFTVFSGKTLNFAAGTFTSNVNSATAPGQIVAGNIGLSAGPRTIQFQFFGQFLAQASRSVIGSFIIKEA